MSAPPDRAAWHPAFLAATIARYRELRERDLPGDAALADLYRQKIERQVGFCRLGTDKLALPEDIREAMGLPRG